MNNFNLISVYIATIIILVITIGIGAVLYLYFSGYISELTSETEETTTIKSIIECSKARIDSYAYITTTTLKDFKYGDFNYRIPITITERSGNTLTDYQVLVVINTQNLISQGKMRNDCGDIRFTDSDRKTLLNYWIEPNTCNTENTRIWVKVPYIPANSQKTIYLYYGNPEASSLSNGTATFIAFDWKFDGPISAGEYHTCALLSNGSIMCWGYNGWGQLGIGYTSESEPTPKQVIGIDNAIAISAGESHTCALLSNGSIMCWGHNLFGQLGIGYTSGSEPTPKQVIGIDNAIAISADLYHTCALLSNGSIMCWGYNYLGQLGIGYTSGSEPTPKQVIGIDNAIAISAGGGHTCALLSNGSIMCWGYNEYDQLGIGYKSESEPTPKQVIGIDNAIAISAGESHTCALLSNGSIMCWGHNLFGQLGIGYTSESEPTPKQVIGIDNAIAISAGLYHTCALLSNGSIMCWGYNYLGQLGIGYTSESEPTPKQVIGIDNTITISIGFYHTCALLSNGSIMCWGYNEAGQLGIGYTSYFKPIPQQTLNYNLGGMYFKTNDIYTPHTPNDIYFVRVYVEIEPTVSLGNEETSNEGTSPIIKLNMINLGIELGKRYLIKLIYEDGKVIVRNITLDKNLSSGESKETYLTDLPKGIIRKIEIYSIDVCPNMLVGVRSVNIEV